MEGDAPNVHRSGTKAPGDIKSRKEPPICKHPLCPSADVLHPPGTQLGTAVAPGDLYELQSSTWFIPRPGTGCSQVRNQLQKVLFAATPLSQGTRADAPLLVCCDSESCHCAGPGHKSQGQPSSRLQQVRAAQSANRVRSPVPGMLNMSSSRPQPGTLPGQTRVGCAPRAHRKLGPGCLLHFVLAL